MVLVSGPAALFGVGLVTHPLTLLAGACAATATQLRMSPALLRTKWAVEFDEWIGQTHFVSGLPERRRKRIRRLRRTWPKTARLVVLLDGILSIALLRSVVDPTAGTTHVGLVPVVIATMLLLGCVIGTAWVCLTWFELRQHRRPPPSWSPDPMVRCEEIAPILEGDQVVVLTWTLMMAAPLLAALSTLAA